MQANLTLNNDTTSILKQELPANQVLSVVLDVNPASPANQGGNVHTRAKHLMHDLEASDSLTQTVLDDLGEAQHSTRTRLYFLWDEHGHVKHRILDTPLEIPEQASFGAPSLEPLRFALESNPQTVIALIDREWGRLFRIQFGEIIELRRLENVLEHSDDAFREHPPQGQVQTKLEDTDPHHDSGRRVLSRNTDNDRLEHSLEHQDKIFHKSLVKQLVFLHQANPFERLLLAGTTEARVSLKKELPNELEKLLCGEFVVLGDASPAVVFEAAKQALVIAEIATENTLLEEARERGVRGLAETLKAVQEGRIYQLLVPGDGSSLNVWRDTEGYVFGEYPEQGQSPLTGWTLEGKSLREVLPELRERFGLRTRFLNGENAQQLESEMGGLAGLARY